MRMVFIGVIFRTKMLNVISVRVSAELVETNLLNIICRGCFGVLVAQSYNLQMKPFSDTSTGRGLFWCPKGPELQ